MDRKVVWSHQATEDVRALAEYIARDSTYYAASFIRKIRDTARTLNILPERGRVVPELGEPAIRELLIRNYRLMYAIEESRVIVLALIHGMRDLKKLWDQEGRKPH